MAVRKPTPPSVRQFVDPQLVDLVVPQAAVTLTASAVAAVTTDSTGGSTVAAAQSGVGEYWMAFQLDLADVADGDLITDMTIGHKFKVLDTEFIATEGETAAGKATTLSLDIGTTTITGSALALTTSNCTTAGSIVTLTTAMSGNTGSASATLTLKAASTTAFTSAKGIYRVLIQNMDTADAFTAILEDLAALRTGVNAAIVDIAAIEDLLDSSGVSA